MRVCHHFWKDSLTRVDLEYIRDVREISGPPWGLERSAKVADVDLLYKRTGQYMLRPGAFPLGSRKLDVGYLPWRKAIDSLNTASCKSS